MCNLNLRSGRPSGAEFGPAVEHSVCSPERLAADLPDGAKMGAQVANSKPTRSHRPAARVCWDFIPARPRTLGDC
jgi:hypothetical protein